MYFGIFPFFAAALPTVNVEYAIAIASNPMMALVALLAIEL
jgi:hypothetical protein